MKNGLAAVEGQVRLPCIYVDIQNHSSDRAEFSFKKGELRARGNEVIKGLL